jgi:nucleoside-diphosphate-sugar epimerase
VRGADDKAETEHLVALGAGAGEGRLRVFPGDLLDGAALMAAARGCSGVFHLATPCTVYPVSDPQGQMVVPAVEGTLNVLRAAKEARTVRRVVVTSSSSAIIPSPAWPAGEPRDERCWADVDYCKKNEVSRRRFSGRHLFPAHFRCLGGPGGHTTLAVIFSFA